VGWLAAGRRQRYRSTADNQGAPAEPGHWQELRLPGYLGGPSQDRTGGLITFQAEDDEQARRAVDADPSCRRVS
jgi:hypothetical protein